MQDREPVARNTGYGARLHLSVQLIRELFPRWWQAAPLSHVFPTGF